MIAARPYAVADKLRMGPDTRRPSCCFLPTPPAAACRQRARCSGALARRCSGGAACTDAAMPRWRCADGPADRGAVFQAQFTATRRSRRAEQQGAPSRAQRTGSHALLPPGGGALVDLWHADERGDYDNAGFRYRGHLFTDGEGRYRFRTILPALYTGRTRHYHVKVQAPQQPCAHHPALFSRRADEPARRSVPPRTGDAHGRGRRRSLLPGSISFSICARRPTLYCS